MPIYEYKCSKCGESREVNMPVDQRDGHVMHCDQVMERQLSAPGFQLKGDGWYATDFKNDAPRKDNHGAD